MIATLSDDCAEMTLVRRRLRSSLCALSAFAAAGCAAAAPTCATSTTSLEGRWRVQDEQGIRAVVDVGRHGTEWVGIVREITPRRGEPAEPRCDACTGAERGKPIRGLEILRLARGEAQGTWEGTVLDPEEGQRYRASAALVECGRVLKLRGYVLLSIFGREERWRRAD
jgi:uncharacterized protein (DUF2147 family)